MDLNPRFTFDAFVVGPTNRMAHAAALKVSQSPGHAYNPLLIYGRSGLGKTHLLQAVGQAAQAAQSELRVRYLTLEEYLDQMHAALAGHAAEALRKSIGESHVLMIDDIQFLANQREMQAELLQLSEAMQKDGRQLLLASDRPPNEIDELDERLSSKLTSGLMVDVAPPDFETRLAILRRKAGERGMNVYPGVLEAVAEIETPSVRELVGLINRLAAFQAMGDQPLTQEAAKKLLEEEKAEAKAADTRAEARARPEPALKGGTKKGLSGPVVAERGPQSASAAPAKKAPPAPPVDEFAAFLSAVTRTVEVSLDSWRSRVGEAVMRWQGEGYRTARLEALLNKEEVANVENHLAGYAADVETLKQLAEEAGAIDPVAAGNARFRDPDGIDEAKAFVKKLREGLIPPPAPTPTLTFDNLVAGAVNDAVLRAAHQVVKEPGKRYNPLFLAGASGTGKSHLLHAIGNALMKGGKAAVACLTTQAFVEELLTSRDADKVEQWRRRYRRVDAFLLDDVQLLSGKDQTQDELFNLFNVLSQADKQIVFAADAPPDRLAGIAERLRTRFEGGLVTELAAPDAPMRAELIRRIAAAHGVKGDGDAIEFLAARPADSVRAVQGLVNKALAAIDGEVLTLEAARAALGVRAPRASQAQAISAPVPSSLDPILASREKMVWDWTEIADRLAEELH